MKKIVLILLLAMWAGHTMAQSIQKAEYFIDTDPGLGAGINLTLTPADSVVIALNIPLSAGLSNGFHKLYMRAKDSNGKWSMAYQQNFYKTAELTLAIPNISKLEYFIDTDPGFGLANDLAITAGQNITKDLLIPIPQNLTLGFHKFFVRAKDGNGKWSIAYQQNFYKTKELSLAVPNISKLEYFIDTDPGFGLANDLAITAGQNITKDLLIPIPQNLPLGFHKFFIRAKDTSGKWSIVYSQNFYKTNDLPTLQNITKLEYFFNTDPGYGLATAVPIIPNTTIDLNSQVFTIDNTLSNGTHQFTLRAQDALGKWSIIANKTINVCELGASITATPSLNTCGTAVTLTANIQNPGSIIWKWIRDGQDIGFDNQTEITVTQSGRYNIQMNNGGGGVCDVVNSGFADVHIKKVDSLHIKSDALASFCGSNVKLQINTLESSLSSDFGFSYQWLKNGNIVATTEQLEITQGGDYQLKMNYLGGYASCAQLQSNILTIDNKKPLLSISPTSTSPNIIEVCQGATIRLNAICDLTENLTYQWFKNNVLIGGQTGPSLTVVNAPGDYQVKLSTGCAGLASAVYPLTYKPILQPPFTIVLTEGSLNSCPGVLAKIKANSCSGNVIWSNNLSVTGNELTIAQQNIPQTFSAYCQSSCVSSSTNELTFSPSAPTLSAPIIQVERQPSDPEYTFAKSSGYYQQPQFKYADYNPPVGIIPTANGQIFYTDAIFNLHLLKDDQSTILVQNESVTGSAADLILLKNDLLLTTGTSSAAVGGNKSVASFGGDDFWVLARNHSGQKSWDKTYGGTGTDKAIKAVQLANGNILIAGESSSAVNGNKTSPALGGVDIWVIKTEADGQKINDFSFGGNGTESLADVVVLSNSNILLIGSSTTGINGNKTSAALGGKDIWLVCINNSGAIVWQKTLGTNQNEEGISAIEKNGFIYVISTDHKVHKLDISGNEINNAFFDFNDYYFATSHLTDLHSIYLTPDNGILITARVSGQAEFGNTGYSYDALYTFEIDQNLNLIESTKEIFGSSSSDNLGKCFFDLQGDFHLVKKDALFECPNPSNPIWYAYYLDNSAYHNANCNRPSDNFYGWYQWVISPHEFENRNYIDYCKGTEFLLRAKTTNTTFEGQVSFQWSTGDTTATIRVTPQSRIPISLSYKPKNLQNFCGSPVSHIDLLPYQNKLLISGINTDDASQRFAHQELFSTEKLQVAKQYHAEKGIFLQPGFEVKATVQNTFEASIEGCPE